MSLEVKVAEGNKPLEGCDEDKAEEDSDSLKKNNHGIDLDVVNLLTKVVIELVSVDQEVPSKQSGNTKTEEEALDVDDELDNQEERGDYSKPFEEISVRNVTHKGTTCTFCSDGVGKSWLNVLRLRSEQT